MSLNRKLQSLKAAVVFGGVLGLGFGCVIDLSPSEPCASGSNNRLDSNGECECKPFYEWCEPTNDANLNCCSTTGGSGTEGSGDGDGDAEAGDGDGDGDAEAGDGDGEGDGDGDGDGDPGTLPPEDCSADEEGAFWCTHDEPMGPEGSRFFTCQGGKWVEDTTFLDDECKFIGWDFAYGCIDDGVSVVPICGDGSGAACNNSDPAFCVDDDQIAYCDLSKETWDSCQVFCQDVGIDGITYEYGECDSSIPDDVACFCCDSGDEGCPI